VYSNLYVAFTLVKVLSVQLGVDVHYHTSYHAPYYEPATQQFHVQDKIKTGNYPLINAYANFHLKQARFFVSGYNLGTLFINHPAYFSMPHYPLNPMVIKMGVSVMFNN
ncbi:MAG: putative porin, partial [Tannerella sp.]|nr:putative porin [Tannerella sp.]